MKSSDQFFNEGNYKIFRKDYDGAFIDFTNAIASDPGNAAPYVNRGFVKHVLKDYDGEIEDYSKALIIEPENETALLNRGLALLKLNQYGSSFTDLTKVIDLCAHESKAYYYRAIVKENLKDYSGALSDILKAFDIDPNLKIHNKENDYETQKINNYFKTIFEYSEILKINPWDIEAFMRRASFKDYSGDQEGAIADYSRMIEKRLALAECFYRRGYIKFSHFRDYRAAIKDFSEAIKLDPNNGFAYLYRAGSNCFINNDKGASDDFSHIVTIYEQSNLDDRDDAEFLCEQALLGRARIRQDSGDYSGALNDYTYTIKIDYASDEAYIGRGTVRSILKDQNGADSDFRKAKKINERRAKVLYSH